MPCFLWLTVPNLNLKNSRISLGYVTTRGFWEFLLEIITLTTNKLIAVKTQCYLK